MLEYLYTIFFFLFFYWTVLFKINIEVSIIFIKVKFNYISYN